MRIIEKISGLVHLVRPELPLAAGLCVAVGELLALGAWPSPRSLALGFTCGFLLSASALVLNDIFDLAVDRVNAPHRPLPSGRVTAGEAALLGLACGVGGLAAAWELNPLALWTSLAVWVIGYLYNWKLKTAGLWGNLMVSLSVGMTFVTGGIAVGRAWQPSVWLFGGLALFFNLGEEIAGDAMDADGDRARGSRSIAILSGRETALRLSAAFFGVVILLSLLPLALGGTVAWYGPVIGLTDLYIFVLAVQLLRSRSIAAGRRIIRWLYLGATLGMAAFFLSAFLT